MSPRSMPRFFFHIRDTAGLIADPDGLELVSLEAAISEAEASARSVAAQRRSTPGSCQIEVHDEKGLILAVVPVFHAN